MSASGSVDAEQKRRERLRANLPRLIDLDAHFVRVHRQTRGALDAKWQERPAGVQDVLAAIGDGHHIALVPASLGLMVVDVDVPHDAPAEEKKAHADRLERHVVDLLGEPLVTNASGRGGRHLWYRAPEDEQSLMMARGRWYHDGQRGGEIRCRAGYIIIWDSAAVVHAQHECAAAEPADVAALKAGGAPPRRNGGTGPPSGPKDGYVFVTPAELSAMAPNSGRNDALLFSIKEMEYQGKLTADLAEQYRAAGVASGLPPKEVWNAIANGRAYGRKWRQRADVPHAKVDGGEEWLQPPPPGRPPDTGEPEPLPAGWQIGLTDPIVLGGDAHGWLRAKAVDAGGETVVDRRLFTDLGVDAERGIQSVLDSYVPKEWESVRNARNVVIAGQIEKVLREAHRVRRYRLSEKPPDPENLFIDALGTRLPRNGFFLAYGERKIGKSWLTRYLVMDLARKGIRVAWVDAEDAEAGDWYAHTAYAGVAKRHRQRVDENVCRLTTSRINTPAGLRALHEAISDFGAEYLVFDSATAASADDLNGSAAAAAFYERMRTLPVAGGFVVAHTAKSNFGLDEGGTALGSTLWEALARGMGSVTKPENDGHFDTLDEQASDVMAPSDGFEEEEPKPIAESESFDVRFRVTGSNGEARAGDGCILRVIRMGDVTEIAMRPLKKESRSQRLARRRKEEREKIEAAFGDRILNARMTRAAIRSQFPDGLTATDADTMVQRGIQAGWIAMCRRGQSHYHVLSKHADDPKWQKIINPPDKKKKRRDEDEDEVE